MWRWKRKREDRREESTRMVVWHRQQVGAQDEGVEHAAVVQRRDE
jgi:hypothetical protein